MHYPPGGALIVYDSGHQVVRHCPPPGSSGQKLAVSVISEPPAKRGPSRERRGVISAEC